MKTGENLGLLKSFVARLLTSFCREDGAVDNAALSSPAQGLNYLRNCLEFINIWLVRQYCFLR